MAYTGEQPLDFFVINGNELGKTFDLRLQIFKTKTKKQFPIREVLKNDVIDADSQQPRGY